MIITITGYPGAGKTTVGKMLAKKLGIKYFYIGDIMRKMARENKIPLEELQKKAEKDFNYDKKIDAQSINLSKKYNDFILDARLGFYFIPESIKIYLYAEPKIAAERIMKDKRIEESRVYTKKDFIKKIRERVRSENKRYKKYYGINIHDLKNYDIIIDTTNMSRNDVIKAIINILKHKKYKKKNKY